MGIESNTNSPFSTTFGNRKNTSRQAANQTDDRPKAKFWLNIGMTAEHTVEGEDDARFISLPTGIPLDTQDKLPTNSRNDVYRQFNAARNDLMDQLIAFAEQLQPGEECILPLQIQLRRVNEEQTEVDPGTNLFGINLGFERKEAA